MAEVLTYAVPTVTVIIGRHVVSVFTWRHAINKCLG
jgi:hypothetical protein